MRAIVVVLALAAAACPSTPKGGGDGGAAVDLSMHGPPDLTPRPTAGIACGANTCTTTLELCCTADNGATGVCQRVQNPSCGDSEFLCDGPEDCPPATPDCCVNNGFANCYQSGVCQMTTGSKFMCHTATDCTNVAPGALCHIATNSPYGLCF